MRRRRVSPKFTTSLIAPIVQKLTRVATAPNTAASTNASPVTSPGRWLASCMSKLWHARVPAAAHPSRRRFRSSGARVNPVGAIAPLAMASRGPPASAATTQGDRNGGTHPWHPIPFPQQARCPCPQCARGRRPRICHRARAWRRAGLRRRPTGQRRSRLPSRRSVAVRISEGRPTLGRRHARAGVWNPRLQHDREPRPGRDERRRRQRGVGRDRIARAVGLRAERARMRRHQRLAQEQLLHRRVLFHGAA